MHTKIVNFTVHNLLRKFKSPQKDAKAKNKRVSKMIDGLTSMKIQFRPDYDGPQQGNLERN